MILIKDMEMPACCSRCKLCDTYCLVLRGSFAEVNPNEERLPDCPLVDVFVDEEGYLHPVE